MKRADRIQRASARLIGMLAAGLLAMGLSSRCAHAQPAAVTISDRVLNPDGTGWTGTLSLTAPGMICNGAPIGPTKLTFMVSGGTIIPSMALFPLADCSPGYPYTVTYSGTSRASYFWWIHASPAVTTISAIQTDSALTPLMQLSFSQFPSGTAAGQVPTWNGSSWGLVIGGGGGGLVSSVFGRIGAISAQAGDYTTAQVAESGNLYFTNARVQAAMAGLYQTPLTWLGSGISGALDQILGSAAQKPASYFQTAIGGAPASWPSFATVATSGNYNDLSNKPTIPAAQVQSDWNASSGMGVLLNKPTTWPWASLSGIPSFAAVATSGSYADLSSKPTILSNPMTTAGDLLVGGTGGAFTRLATPGNGTFCTNWSGGVVTLITCPGAGGGLSSVGLTMPSAFSVAGSPLTSNGTLAVTGAGTASQYVLGNGSLATFPTTWAWGSLSGVPSLVNTVNGQTGAITLGNGFSGLTPGWSAGTLNIPLASTASATAGLLSNTDYLSFAAKQAAISGAPGSWPAFSTVATSGSYNDLSNKPTIPAAQVNSDWSSVSGLSQILNKPTTWPWGSLSGIPSTFAPSAHAATHASAGSDPVTLSESQVTGLVSDLAGKQPTLGYTAENAANKGAANGYAPLNASGDVPVANLPVTGSGTTVPTLDATPTVGDCLAWSANGVHDSGSPCGTGGGGMVYPGAGIPVSTGSGWGTSLAAPTGGIADTGASNTFAAGTKQTFQGTSGSLAPINILPIATAPASPTSGDVWIIDSSSPAFNYRRGSASYTLLNLSFGQTLTANHKLTSSATGALTVQPGAAYTGSADGALNRNNATTPAMMQVYDSSVGIAKNITMPGYVTFSATGASAAVSAATLFTPSSAALQIWAVDAAVVQKTPGTGCSGSYAVTITWTDDGGSLNSYSLATFTWASANAAASGTSLGTRASGHMEIHQTSTTAPTYAVSIPTGCTGMAYDWSVSAARIG